MDQVIFKYPGQKFVGIATRKADGTLNHQGYVLIDAVPRKGATLFDRPVSEMLTEEELLKERSRCALNEIAAIAVLARTI
jgi:lipoate-protein ligase A